MKKSLLLSAAALLLTACERPVEPPAFLPADAAAEYVDLRGRITGEYEHMLDEAEKIDWSKSLFKRPDDADERLGALRREFEAQTRMLDEYARSANPNLATPEARQTPLQLATMHRKEALVRELLRQGADPNARSFFNGRELDAALSWAVCHSTVGDARADKESALRLIKMLVDAGADVTGDVGGHCLFMLSIQNYEGAEDVYLHLLDLGADPNKGIIDMEDPMGRYSSLISRGWSRAARRLHAEGRFKVDDRRVTSSSSCYDEEGNLEREWKTRETMLYSEIKLCILYDDDAEFAALKRQSIALLLELGADIHAPHKGGMTPLFEALRQLPKADAPQEQVENRGKLLLLLLEHGASMNTPCPAEDGTLAAHSGKTMADILRSRPRLAAWLAEHGHPLPAPAPGETP